MKIKMSNKYKAGQCIYNLIDICNRTKKHYRKAGNLWSLKNMIKEETLHEKTVHREKELHVQSWQEQKLWKMYVEIMNKSNGRG